LKTARFRQGRVWEKPGDALSSQYLYSLSCVRGIYYLQLPVELVQAVPERIQIFLIIISMENLSRSIHLCASWTP